VPNESTAADRHDADPYVLPFVADDAAASPTSPETERIKTAPQPPDGEFHERLAPPQHHPTPPIVGQQGTCDTQLQGVRHSVMAAQEALAWPVAKYARFCAELRVYGEKADLVCANYGLGPMTTRAFVNERWHKRLSADPQLHAKWNQLVEDSVAELKSQLGADDR